MQALGIRVADGEKTSRVASVGLEGLLTQETEQERGCQTRGEHIHLAANSL
jgi:hypothetical protein